MPYYNRFDICAAYYHYACLMINTYYYLTKIDSQLHRMKYRPGLSDSRLSTLTPNAKAIYMQLVRKHYGRG